MPMRMALFVIAYHAGDNGETYRGSGTMRAQAGMSKSAWKLAVKKLKEQGLLTTISRYRNDGGQTSNTYKLLPYPPCQHTDWGGCHSCGPGGGSTYGLGGVQSYEPPIKNSSLIVDEEYMISGKPQENNLKHKSVAGVMGDFEPLEKEEIFKILETKLKEGKLTPSACGWLWKNCRASASESGEFQAELTSESLKQLHRAYGRVGEEFPESVWSVMSDWIGFTRHAQSVAGAFGLPTLPSIPFFVKFVEASVGFCPSTLPQSAEGFLQLSADDTDDYLTKQDVVGYCPPSTFF